MFKEFRCPENTDKVLSVQYFSPDRPKIITGWWKTIKFKQQIEFQSFKIIQDFKKLYMQRFLNCLVNCHRISTYTWYEPRHDKTNKVTVRPVKTQISLGIRSVWSVFAVRMKKAWVLSFPCLGWSESSLGAQSLCWFCHVAAHIVIRGRSLFIS